MKIVHVNRDAHRAGGTEVYLLGLLDALQQQGHEVLLVHDHDTPPPVAGVPACRIAAVSAFGASTNGQFEQVLRRERPHLIHLHNVFNVETMVTSSRVAPTVRTMHALSIVCPGGEKYLVTPGRVCTKAFGAMCLGYGVATHCMSWRPAVFKESYARVSALITHDRQLPATIVASGYMRAQLVQNGFDPSRLYVMPYFVDVPAGQRLEEDPPIVLFTGRVVERKGLVALIEALARVRASFRLVVTGDGPALPAARAAAVAHRVRAEFTGWLPREEQLAWYRRAALLAVPSLWPEPFGLVGPEAMACETPVVAFDVGGISDWLDEGRTGFLVPPGDIARLAERLSHLLSHPGERRAMGLAGRARVERDYGVATHVHRLVALYEEVVSAWRAQQAPEAAAPVALSR